ncbi:hypothetical protein VTJ04DRAFT_3748 [Mycothermus thermophilus]|uniref:uncharacterized protein n=1 Tax=Humicola insolens TaxID=85995 RepID=UPI003744ABEC
MDRHSPPEFILEALADPNSVRDVVRGILHTIFFLRYFPTITPQTRDVLGLELAYIPDAEIETLIDQRVAALARQLETERHQPSHSSSGGGYLMRGGGGGGGVAPASNVGSGGRGQITIQFLEKRRRKTWYALRGDDEVPWESWTVKVTVADPRTEGERAKLRRASETTLHSAILKAITLANTHKDHIPPITTTESNPFPYQIHVGPPSSSSSSRDPAAQQQHTHQQQQQFQKEPPLSPGRSGSVRAASPAAAAVGGVVGGVAATAAKAAGWATRMGIY